MDLSFRTEVADGYASGTQRIRVLSEDWMAREMFCIACGNQELAQHPPNRKAGDFYCSCCNEQYELKSSKRFGRKLVNGTFATTIERLRSTLNPNLCLLTYDQGRRNVVDFLVIPKQLFTVDCVEERPPLSAWARRKGWVGCNIVIDHIPKTGRVVVVEAGAVRHADALRQEWDRLRFLSATNPTAGRRWLVEVMRIIDRVETPTFTLREIYRAEHALRGIFPRNQHIREKIRQQLQHLRDQGYVEFLGNGHYRLCPHQSPD